MKFSSEIVFFQDSGPLGAHLICARLKYGLLAVAAPDGTPTSQSFSAAVEKLSQVDEGKEQGIHIDGGEKAGVAILANASLFTKFLFTILVPLDPPPSQPAK